MNVPLALTVVMYHYIRDPGDLAEAGSGIPGMPVRVFEAQLDELSSRHTFVTWRDVRMALQGQSTLPDSACLLTFDDGICDHYLNAFRILRSRNLSGLFFILDRSRAYSLVVGHKIHFLLASLGVDKLQGWVWKKLDPTQRKRFRQAEQKYWIKYAPSSLDGRIDLLKAVLQRELSLEVDALLSDLFEKHVGSEKEITRSFYLSVEQIKEMSSAGMHFGGHSRSHPWFDWINADAREAEICASAGWIRQFEPEPWAFAYPYGGVSNDMQNLLREAGFIAAFTTRAQLRHPNPYFIGRLDGEEMSADGQPYA